VVWAAWACNAPWRGFGRVSLKGISNAHQVLSLVGICHCWGLQMRGRVNKRSHVVRGILIYPMLVMRSQYLADKANVLPCEVLYDQFICN
jgi:hypothetical protein